MTRSWLVAEERNAPYSGMPAAVIATSTVITVITTPTLSSLTDEGAHRLQNRSAPVRWNDGITGDGGCSYRR